MFANANCPSKRNADSYCYGDSLNYAHGNTERYSHSHSYGYSYNHSYDDANCQTPTNTEVASYARAAAVGKRAEFWVAHASRVLVSASRRNELSKHLRSSLWIEHTRKSAMARTPSPTRETRALPRIACAASPPCLRGGDLRLNDATV